MVVEVGVGAVVSLVTSLSKPYPKDGLWSLSIFMFVCCCFVVVFCFLFFLFCFLLLLSLLLFFAAVFFALRKY